MKVKFLILLSFLITLSNSAEECADTSDKCSAWAKNGFCTNCFYNCDIRVKYCAKTCEYCTGQKTCENCTVTTTKPPPTTTTINCVDYGDYCKSWAMKGFCSNCFYKCSDRIKYCAKTCGFCTAGSCTDCNNVQNFKSLISQTSLELPQE
ncbi:hypothetical protein GCK72_005755 [Caenorhabditis remanei]|uniref:ShKT domain-containing protein n=1 Tax=Caenorhabditis remanei TaxID=31234 RepID=A0A6A5HII1_CAERE|nr:hypothetical protein GCK72_005755 [Caenorhabditis remanei]KAF1765802.1 hypothetical protein GCK72_005755 [Caenorhabditis remanei]